MNVKLIIKCIIFIIFLNFTACTHKQAILFTLEEAGENRKELEKVLEHYKNDTLKLKAAYFLIENMVNKHYYTGELLDKYDTIFHLYDSLRRHQGIIVGDPPVILSTWDSLKSQFGSLTTSKLNHIWDCQSLKADFLIENIDWAFEAWKSTPKFISRNFISFCEFILPYRGGDEIPESYRQKYYNEFHHLRDTATNDSITMLNAFNSEFYWERNYKPSEKMWSYPVALPISKMELGRRGACRHTSVFCAQVMRACGIPVAIDFVKAWGNRSRGHDWNVLIQDNGKIYPFNPFEKEKMEFVYKPAKIHRRMFSNNHLMDELPDPEDVPNYMINPDEMDVTHQYGQTYDIEIACEYPFPQGKKKRHALICVFDNIKWIPIYWGKIEKGKATFKNMMGDVCYMMAYYQKGNILPAGQPFILTKKGEINRLSTNMEQRCDMKILRKYPRFARMELFAMNLRRSTIEGANDREFKNAEKLYDVMDTPNDVNDTVLNSQCKFRFVRWKIVDYRTGDLAEVEFYGKKSINDPEIKLEGKLIGCPEPTENDMYPYSNAMDGDPATFFGKPKNQLGYVGLDLGIENEAYITRVRFYPRSDTNYILIGDTYELCYWYNGEWQSAGIQQATRHELTFKDVPQGTFYILHDLTKGKEERIFTYENGEQIWW